MQINGNLIEHIYDKLIDRSLFDTVQDILEGKTKAPFKAGYGEYPLCSEG